MASTTGISVPTYSPPTFNESSGVITRIESQVGSIRDMFAEVQRILADLQSLTAELGDLKPPTDPKARDYASQLTTYNTRVSQLQGQINQLNGRLESTYRKLGQAQAILNQLQTQDLPTAQRNDANRLSHAIDDARKALENGAQAIKDTAKADADPTDGVRVQIRVQDRNIEIRLASDSSFRDIVRGFSLVLSVVGDGSALARRANPAVAMPHTPGSGLPGVGTP